MALTRIAQPNRWSAVYSPIIYRFQSSFATGYRVTSPVGPLVIASTNGFLTVTFDANHNMVAGDYAYITSDFSGIYRVISAPSATQLIFDCDDTVGQNLSTAYKYAYKYTGSAKVFAKISGVYTDIGMVNTKPVDNGSTIVFTFDVAGIIQKYITSNLPDLNSNTINDAPDAFKEYYIETSEAYIRGVGGYPEYVQSEFTPDYEDSIYTINEKVAVNATEQYAQQIGETYKQQYYVFNSGADTLRFLSNQPDGVKISACREFWFYFNNEESTAFLPVTVNIKQYQNETLLSTTTTQYTDLPVGQHFIALNSSTFTLNPLATSVCIEVEETTGQTGLPICFDVISEDCNCDNRYQLVWLNNKGGYSSEYLTGKATHGIDVDRQGQIKYNLQPSNFSPSNRQYGNVQNVARKRITLTHESTKQSVHEWLASEVMTSIDVLLKETIDGVDYLIPLQIDTDTVTLYKDRDKRFVFVFDALLAYDLQIQTR